MLHDKELLAYLVYQRTGLKCLNCRYDNPVQHEKITQKDNSQPALYWCIWTSHLAHHAIFLMHCHTTICKEIEFPPWQGAGAPNDQFVEKCIIIPQLMKIYVKGMVGFPASCKVTSQQAEKLQFHTSYVQMGVVKGLKSKSKGVFHFTFQSFPTRLGLKCYKTSLIPGRILQQSQIFQPAHRNTDYFASQQDSSGEQIKWGTDSWVPLKEGEKYDFFKKCVRGLKIHIGFIVNISFAFQAIKNPSAHNTKLCCGIFCDFFWWFLGIFGKRYFFFSKD